MLRGYLAIVAASLLWALNASLAKWIFSSGLPVELVVHYRLLVSAVLICVLLRRIAPQCLRIAPRDLWWVLLLGSAFAVNYYSYFQAVRLLNIASGVFLQYLAPVIVMAGALLRGHLAWSLQLGLLAALMVTGSYFVAGMHDVSFALLSWEGLIAGLLAALSYAIYTMVGEVLGSRYRSLTVLFYGFVSGGILWTIAYGPHNLWSVPLKMVDVFALGYVIILGTIVPFALMYAGIRRVGASHAAMTAMLEPVFAGGFAYLLHRETLSQWQVLGGAMIVAAVILLQFSRGIRRKTPVDLRRASQAKFGEAG